VDATAAFAANARYAVRTHPAAAAMMQAQAAAIATLPAETQQKLKRASWCNFTCSMLQVCVFVYVCMLWSRGLVGLCERGVAEQRNPLPLCSARRSAPLILLILLIYRQHNNRDPRPTHRAAHVQRGDHHHGQVQPGGGHVLPLPARGTAGGGRLLPVLPGLTGVAGESMSRLGGGVGWGGLSGVGMGWVLTIRVCLI